VEIERKWLVRTLPADLTRGRSRRIRQGYVAIDPSGTEVRVRDDDGVLGMTVKSSGDLVRAEIEIALSQEQFEALWALTAGRRVEKVRTDYPLGGSGADAVAEVDVFEGALAPLILVEVEFASEDAAAAFGAPVWMADEVTTDKRYKNRNLAVSAP
jgi:CYTH domain-containing protein